MSGQRDRAIFGARQRGILLREIAEQCGLTMERVRQITAKGEPPSGQLEEGLADYLSLQITMDELVARTGLSSSRLNAILMGKVRDVKPSPFSEENIKLWKDGKLSTGQLGESVGLNERQTKVILNRHKIRRTKATVRAIRKRLSKAAANRRWGKAEEQHEKVRGRPRKILPGDAATDELAGKWAEGLATTISLQAQFGVCQPVLLRMLKEAGYTRSKTPKRDVLADEVAQISRLFREGETIESLAIRHNLTADSILDILGVVSQDSARDCRGRIRIQSPP